jgi:rRNA processing protein Gar1
LISKASDEVKRKLARERPEMGSQVQTAVTAVTGMIHAKFGPASRNYFAAKRSIGKLHEQGGLNEEKLFELAYALKFDETAVALSLLCDLPIDVVERAMVDENKEIILILAKALDLSWTTTMSLLFLGAANFRITAGDLETMKSDFARLNVETSNKVLKVFQSRKEEAAHSSGLRHLPQLHSS